MLVRFHVVAPAAKQRTFSVRLPILLGRGEEAKLRIQHDLVSRRHCELFERQGRVYVRDLGSTNGTFLNGEQVPVSTKTLVPPGGIVRVGGLSFAVDYQLPEAADAAAVADHDQREVSGMEESRVEGEGDASLEEQPDFQLVHKHEAAGDDESPAHPEIVAPEQPAACDAGAAAAADTVAAPPPGATEGSTGEPAAPAKQPDGFDFLSASPASTAAADMPQWPTDDAVDDAPDDDQLNSFFKGLK